jgi:uncharacterized protein (TIGR02145 family)
MILTHGANSLPSGGGGDFVNIGGRKYKYVQIGNLLWLAENLDYKFSGCDIGPTGSPSTPAAWYYNNDEATYGIDGTYKCGLLYNGYAALYLENHKSSLLPDGWRVPLKSDLQSLPDTLGSWGAQQVMAEPDSISQGYPPTSWEGTNEYGFSASPSGYRDSGATFKDFNTSFYIWSATSLDSSYITSLKIGLQGSGWYFNLGDYYYYKSTSLSIRLVKDAT